MASYSATGYGEQFKAQCLFFLYSNQMAFVLFLWSGIDYVVDGGDSKYALLYLWYNK